MTRGDPGAQTQGSGQVEIYRFFVTESFSCPKS
jgi:hypothetical protein